MKSITWKKEDMEYRIGPAQFERGGVVIEKRNGDAAFWEPVLTLPQEVVQAYAILTEGD